MAIYCLQTLVDITDTGGQLNRAFPFKTQTGELIHDKYTLRIAKMQQQNFNTLIQCLQIRGNIGWDSYPLMAKIVTAQSNFGSAYEGAHKSWAFIFHSDLTDIYADGNNPVGGLEQDLDLIPILNFCKETATFPINAFITQDSKTRNTFVLKVDDNQHIISQRDDLKELIDTYINR